MTSDQVRALLALTGKKQVELAEEFGMQKQSMNRKFSKSVWSADDLVRVAEYCGYKLAFVPAENGQTIYIEGNGEEKRKGPDA